MRRPGMRRCLSPGYRWAASSVVNQRDAVAAASLRMSVNARDWSRRRPFPVTVRLPLAAANDSRVHRRHYVPVCLKFVLALFLALAWAQFTGRDVTA